MTTTTADGAFAGGWLVIEEESRGGARWAVVIAVDPAVVSVAVPVSGMELWAWSVPDGAMPAWFPVLAAAWWEAGRAQVVTGVARAALDQHRDGLEAIVDAAHGWADDNDLCGRFDDFMLEQGLRPRSRDYEITVEVRLRLAVTESGHDADSARDNVYASDVAEAIYNLSRWGLAAMVDDFDVVDVEPV